MQEHACGCWLVWKEEFKFGKCIIIFIQLDRINIKPHVFQEILGFTNEFSFCYIKLRI